MDLWRILIPVVCFGFNILVQILVFKKVRTVTLLKSIFAGFFAGFLALLAGHFFCGGWSVQGGGYFLANIMIYSLMGYCFFNFVCLGETSLRVHILTELASSVEGLTYRELQEKYNAKTIMEIRLRRLLANGQIVLKDEKYFIGKPVMLGMAKTIGIFKKLLFGRIR